VTAAAEADMTCWAVWCALPQSTSTDSTIHVHHHQDI